MKKVELNLSLKPNGDCWLDVTLPHGNSVEINLGQEGYWNDESFVGKALLEAAKLYVGKKEAM